MIVFDHVHKTGGTTFHSSYLPRAFHEDELLIITPESDPLDLVSGDRANGLRVVSGHGAERLRTALPDAPYISIAREPIQRVISGYLHLCYHPDMEPFRRSFRKAFPAKNPGFTDYLQWDQFAQNHQSRILLGGHFHPDITDLEIERALEGRYAVIGTTERFADFIYYLHLAYRFPLALFKREMVRRERSEFRASPAEIEEVKLLNTLDIRLFDIIHRTFERKFASLIGPGDYQDSQRYRKRLEEFEKERSSWPNWVDKRNLMVAYPTLSEDQRTVMAGEISGSPVDLRNLTAAPGSRITSYAKGCILCTSLSQWSYAAWIQFALPDNEITSRRVEISLTVEEGVIGIRWLLPDNTWVVQQRADKGRHVLELTIPRAAGPGRLNFENWTSEGSARAIVERVTLLAD